MLSMYTKKEPVRSHSLVLFVPMACLPSCAAGRAGFELMLPPISNAPMLHTCGDGWVDQPIKFRDDTWSRCQPRIIDIGVADKVLLLLLTTLVRSCNPDAAHMMSITEVA